MPRMTSLLHYRTLLISLVVLLSGGTTGWCVEPVSFRRDVMGVISKAGCNLGACHAITNGKGGLKLSLRGEDPTFDYATLTREFMRRRVNPLEPTASLLLQKPSGGLAHQGGIRFKRDSLEYDLLLRWIAAGAPGPQEDEPPLVRLEVSPPEAVLMEPVVSVQLQVVAHFADGTSHDVSRRAVYELTNGIVTAGYAGLIERLQPGETTIIVRYLQLQVPVRLAFIPQRPDFSWSPPSAANYIDQHLFAHLQELRMNPSDLCDDATFIRRVFLDVIGLLPTLAEAQSFIADDTPDKRQQLIDRLLARPEFAEHWALKWSDLLRNEEKVLDQKGVDLFHGWLRESFATSKPLDQFVRELVASEGSTYANPPANFYRANRDPLTRGETTARLFLGVRLQCARCHNHPFDRWTQDDYYSWGALFARVDYEEVENKRKDKFDLHEFDGEQRVIIKVEGEVRNARSGKDAVPQFLGSQTPIFEVAANRLPPLAQWLGSAQNELFVKSQANFIWYHLMGRGLVDPIDDFRLTNPPSNAPLLSALADDFVASGLDVKQLARTILSSSAYQLSAQPNETNTTDEANFSHAIVRRLPAEKLLDAQSQVLDVALAFGGYPLGTRAGQLRGVKRGQSGGKAGSAAERFLKTFGKSERLLACECERSSETSLKQVFTLIGDEGLEEMLSAQDNRLRQMLASGDSDDQLITQLYWHALTRPPTAAELAAGQSLLSSAPDKLVPLQDLAWALLNAKEFVFRK